MHKIKESIREFGKVIRRRITRVAFVGALLASVVAIGGTSNAQQLVGDQKFVDSAIVNADATVTLPLYRG